MCRCGIDQPCDFFQLTLPAEALPVYRMLYLSSSQFPIRMDGDDDILRKALGDIFTDAFNEKEHLDIAFIGNGQEVEFKKVCQPSCEMKC